MRAARSNCGQTAAWMEPSVRARIMTPIELFQGLPQEPDTAELARLEEALTLRLRSAEGAGGLALPPGPRTLRLLEPVTGVLLRGGKAATAAGAGAAAASFSSDAAIKAAAAATAAAVKFAVLVGHRRHRTGLPCIARWRECRTPPGGSQGSLSRHHPTQSLHAVHGEQGLPQRLPSHLRPRRLRHQHVASFRPRHPARVLAKRANE